MSDIVERLNDEADRLERRAYGDRCTGPDCALASNVAREAAAEIERLRAERDEAIREVSRLGRELGTTQARLAEAIEVVRDCHDVLHRLTAIIPSNDQALVETTAAMARARDFLAKLEVR